MAKRYSQDLRDRVIDAVERGKMSRRAAGRHYEVSESVAIKWLERLERHGSREPVGHGGHRASKLMPHRDFLQAAQAEKSDITASRLGAEGRAPRRQGPAGQMEDRDVPRRLAQRPHRRALPV